MKKNLPLTILVFFLIIVNSFFLYNYLKIDNKEEVKELKKPGDFLLKELDFNDAQREQFNELEKTHRQQMRGLSNDIMGLKDELFKGLSDTSHKDANIDSIASLIGEKEAAKDLEVFRYFDQVQELCNDEQKKIFSKIVKDALRRGARGNGPPRGGRPDGNRPNRPDGPHGDRPPPRER